MPRSWNADEDRLLFFWVGHFKKTGMSRTQTFEQVAEKLGRSANACYARWKLLISRGRELDTSTTDRRKKLSELEQEQDRLREKIDHLEQLIRSNHERMDQLFKENRKMREEMKFFELLLIEEYHLLVQLLGKHGRKARIHHL